MSLGPMMIDLLGPELLPEERELLRHPLVGGVILFSRNYVSAKQIEALVGAIHAVRDPHLLVAVDQEGGRVQRFREGFTRLPPVALLGALYDKDARRALHLAEITGWLMASELRAVGVDLSFAPVLDVDCGISSVIGDRAFHRDPEAAARLAHNYATGMMRAGMAATGKHFPGHGRVCADSHLALPVDERLYEDVYNTDIVPFERMIHYGLPAIMVAHIVYSRIDPHPAGFSAFWLKEVLRNRLGFQGAVFSDDLSMGGAAGIGDYLVRARTALHAGCDMVLVCNNRQGAIQVIDGLGDYKNPASAIRLARMHGRHAIKRADLTKDPAWCEAVRQLQEYDPAPLLDMDM